MTTKVLQETDVTLKVVHESDEDVREQQLKEAWEKVYGARQNNSVLINPLSGIEQVQGKTVGVVMIDNLIKGIIPLEHSGCENARQLSRLIGQDVYFKVTALDRESRQFAASIQAGVEHVQGLTWDQLQEGMKVEARITDVYMKRMVLDIGAIPVTLPAEEVSHGWIDDLRGEFKRGERIQVRVTELDKEEKKLTVSRKAALPSPWPDCMQRYVEGGIYPGTVSGKEEYGTFVNLEPGVDCLAPHTHPRVGTVGKGDNVFVRVRHVDPMKQRISGRIVRRL